MNISHFLEWFVPAKVSLDARLAGRYRGIAGSLLSISVITSVLAVVYGALRQTLGLGEWAVLAGGILFPVAGTLYIRQTAKITQGLILTNLAGIAVIFGWAVQTGGILSVALPWMIANLGLICTFGNIVIQAAIGGTALAALAILFVLTRYDMLPPSILDAALQPQIAALALITSTALMVGAAVIIADERARAKARLRTALERTEVANRVKSTFLSSMSHEFRTPLSAVLGFAEVLRDGDQRLLSAAQQGYVTHIVQAAEHLSALVDQVLEMARLEAGGVTLTTAPVSVDQVLRSAYSMMSLAAREGQVELLIDLPVEGLVISADETRLRQVLINLISNAIRFNRPGGRVTVHVRPNSARTSLCFEVEDTGHGIPAARQAEVFVAFSRLGAESGRIEGSGLGLVISRRLVELMGGTISFDSTEGAGSRFRFELPWQAAESAR